MVEIGSLLQSLKSRMAKDTNRQPAKPYPDDGVCIPDCQVCRGVGWVRRDLPRHDFRFGKLHPCPNMPPEKLHQEGHFGLYWDEQRRYRWDKVLRINAVGEALDQVRETVERGYGWVYLWGNYGTAKTLLLKTAVAECLRADVHAHYTRMVDLLDDLRLAFDERVGNQLMAEKVHHYTNLPVLALDEIDRINETDWARERIFQLIDRRYDTAQLKRSVTLIASNSRPQELDGYFASRVNDIRFAVIHLPGHDMRLSMKKPDDKPCEGFPP